MSFSLLSEAEELELELELAAVPVLIIACTSGVYSKSSGSTLMYENFFEGLSVMGSPMFSSNRANGLPFLSPVSISLLVLVGSAPQNFILRHVWVVSRGRTSCSFFKRRRELAIAGWSQRGTPLSMIEIN